MVAKYYELFVALAKKSEGNEATVRQAAIV
jgi:hypothetical protein